MIIINKIFILLILLEVVVLINVVEGIQRNKNAFDILAENKRVDIDIAVVVIADNIVKNNYINILLNV